MEPPTQNQRDGFPGIKSIVLFGQDILMHLPIGVVRFHDHGVIHHAAFLEAKIAPEADHREPDKH